jgi:hypothetical protein
MSDETETIVSKKRIKRLKIAITQKEIDESVRGNSNKCMIRDSLKRDHPDFKALWVDKNQVRFTDPKLNVIYTFQMSPVGRVMLLKWDSGETIVPFDVWLANPVVRERQLKGGRQKPKAGESHSLKHRGPVPRPKTKEARLQSGRDRVFGQKLWEAELAKTREYLLPS